jgi:TonB-dependent receptor
LQGPNLSYGAALNFFNTHPGAFSEDINAEHIQNDPNNFDAKEKVWAAYIKNTTRFGALEVVLGVRVEGTNASYTGNKLNLDADGNWISTEPVAGSSTYTNALPSISTRYAIDPNTNIRAVYGWTLGRPDYGELVPSRFQSDTRKEIDAGNPNLKPTRAQSVDLLFEHFFGSLGVVSAGGFYKHLTDPIYPGSASTIHGGIYDGYTLITPINGPTAYIYGAEVAWQQHLGFLPRFLSGLGILANYTYTYSKATFDPSTGRTGTAALQRTTPHEANLGFTYDAGPFSFRIAATYNAATIFTYRYSDGAAGGLTGPNGDTYLYPHTQIDAQGSYAFANGLEAIVSFLNLNNQVFGFYNGSPQWNIQREFYGRSFTLSFKVTR